MLKYFLVGFCGVIKCVYKGYVQTRNLGAALFKQVISVPAKENHCIVFVYVCVFSVVFF